MILKKKPSTHVMRANTKSNATTIQYLTDLLSNGIDVRNRIVYLHGEIDLGTVSYLKTSIETIYLMSEDSVTPVTININSQGGCTFSMFGVVDAFASCSSPINTHCNGTAMSAAAIILASGTGIRSITPNSTVMVHRSYSANDLNELSPEERASHQKLDKKLNSRLFALLPQKSNRDAKFWEKNTKGDFFLEPQEALEYGIVDQIVF